MKRGRFLLAARQLHHATVLRRFRRHAASGISPVTKNFLQKRLSHKGCPFIGTEPFLDRFLGEGA